MAHSFAKVALFDAFSRNENAMPPAFANASRKANSSRAASFPEKRCLTRGNFGQFLRRLEPLEATGVFYSGTAPAGKLPSSIRFIPKSAGDLSMTLTAAHVPAIVALIAGILILVMPRLLNFIVAIYLIFVGLVGLGVLRMFHM
jgi:Protein of unknown function (DUF3096)